MKDVAVPVGFWGFWERADGSLMGRIRLLHLLMILLALPRVVSADYAHGQMA